MTFSTLPTPVFVFSFIGALFLIGGCDSATVAPDVQTEAPSPNSAVSVSKATSETHIGLATVRRATALYHRVEAAIEDGFVQAMPCVDPPGPGAIGIPYVNLDRILDATIDLEKPDVLFYEPQKNGRLRLVGAEPVVRIEDWDPTHDGPPSLFGQEFHRNEEAGLYGLHMWVWLHNPEGVFAFTHPDVSCAFAD